MIHRIFGRSGYGKSHTVYQIIQEKLNEGEKNIVLIVPEQQTVITERKVMELFGNRINMNMEIINFKRLTDFVSRKLGGMTYEYIDETVKKLIMQKTLKGVQSFLKEYGNDAENFDFIAKMTRVINDLKLYLITPTIIESAVEKIESSKELKELDENKYLLNKLNDLNIIYSFYNRQINEELRDSADNMVFLFNLLSSVNIADTGKPFFSDSIVIFDAFDYFSAGQKLIVKKIFTQAKDVYITLKVDSHIENLNAEEKNVFYRILDTKKFLDSVIRDFELEAAPSVWLTSPQRYGNDILKFLERNIFSDYKSVGSIKNTNADEHLEIYKCVKPSDEVELAAKKILYLVREKNFRYREIQVISRDMSRYYGIIDTVFEKYDIPVFMSVPTLFQTKPIVMFLMLLLDMTIYNLKLDSLILYLKTGFAGLTAEQTDKFELYASTWNINGFNRYKDKVWNMHPDGYVEIDENDGEIKLYLEEINQIKDKIFMPIHNFKRKIEMNAASNTIHLNSINIANAELKMRDILRYITEFLEETEVFEQLSEQYEKLKEENNLAEAEETRQIWNILIGLFEKIDLMSGNDITNLKAFVDMFRFIISEQEIDKIPTSIEEVTADNSHNMRSMGIKATFVLGMNNDIFPSVISDEDVFNDKEKEVLKTMGIEYSADSVNKVYDELYSFYNVLTSASEYILITYAMQEMSGDELTPSLFIDRIYDVFPSIKEKCYDFSLIKDNENLMNLFEADKLNKSDELHELSELCESDNIFLYFEGKNAGFEYKDVIEDRTFAAALDEYFSSDSDYKNVYDLMKKLSPIKTNNERISKEMSRKLFRNLALSSSSLETFTKCKFSYFMRYVLRLRKNTKGSFQGTDIGNFIHKVLELFFEKMTREGKQFSDADETYIRKSIDELADNYLVRVITDYEFKTERFRYLFRRLKKTLLALILSLKEEFAQSEFLPKRFELNIASNTDTNTSKDVVNPIEIDIADFGTLKIFGKIDRVDVYKNNRNKKVYIRIIDYKTGTQKFDFSDIVVGLNMQMLIYLFTLWHNGSSALLSDEKKEENNIEHSVEMENEKESDIEIAPAGILYVTSDTSYNIKKDLSDKEKDKNKAGLFKRSGLLVDDISVLKAMEKDLSNRYIPIKTDKEMKVKSTSSGVLASYERIGKLEKYIHKILNDIAKNIADGNAEINPIVKERELESCRFCDYKYICKIEDTNEKNVRNYTKLSVDEVWNIIEERGDESDR